MARTAWEKKKRLARLTFPLGGFSKQLERLLEGYCMEIMATNTYPDQHVPSIKLFAKDLVLVLAFHLAERISSLLRQVMDHPTKVLYDPETEVLFLPQFWLLPIYRELLNTASRIRPSRASVRRVTTLIKSNKPIKKITWSNPNEEPKNNTAKTLTSNSRFV